MEQEQARILLAISKKIGGLGIDAKYTRLEVGPVVTTYYFKLADSMPIAKVMSKAEDFALSCNVESVLITRLGGEIAIAVPNSDRQIVSFDSCLAAISTSIEFKDMKLPLMLGVNTVGKVSALDLADAPHVLVAGQTGGGKSVLLASFIAGLVTRLSPTDLKLITVDTKKLDLPLFSSLPHVIDSIDRVEDFHKSFNILMNMVRKRTDTMKGIARNISEYNKITDKKLPYYVIIIDELGDLIDEDNSIHTQAIEPYCNYPKVSSRIKSLLQICRAAGVHIICATQRSSVKVVNGDIKANLPTRIALRLPSQFDSRTIISQAGAENLLGKGDMLVESAMSATPIRYHGAFVDMDHIARIIDQHEYIRESFRYTQEIVK